MLYQVHEDIENLGLEDRRDGEVLSGRRCAGQDKNAGTNDGSDPECGQRPWPECFLELVLGPLGVADEFVDRLLGKKLAGQKASLLEKLHAGAAAGRA